RSPARLAAGGETGGAAADDDDRRRLTRRPARDGRNSRRQLLANGDDAAAALDTPARERIERRRARRVARREIEACVMEWTSNRVADDEAFRQRSAVMRAGRPDGEEPTAAAHEHDLIVAHASGQDVAVRE